MENNGEFWLKSGGLPVAQILKGTEYVYSHLNAELGKTLSAIAIGRVKNQEQ